MSEKLGLVGRKIGMTRIFTEDGVSIPVTVLEVSNNRITQVKTLKGQFEKAGVEAGSVLKEFHVEEDKIGEMKVGQTLSIDMFSEGQKVDVTGTTIGKGFAGAIKRHHFSSNRASHGNSVSTNAPGSIGNRQDPGRVFPGKRMAGHLGDVQRTTQNLVIARVDADRQLILVRGAVPGCANGEVIIRPAVKAKA